MATTAKKTKEQAIRDLENISDEEMAEAEIIVGHREPAGQPFSVRLSAPLLEKIDRMARRENRKRGNLIQHILWRYVREHESRL